MKRTLNIACGQLGPIHLNDSKVSVVERLIKLLVEAKSRNCDIVVFPELALTTFFPRYWLDDINLADKFYETEMPNKETQPLFDKALELKIGFSLGYAELVIKDGKKQRFNTQIFVDNMGKIVSKYRKIHIPGHSDNQPKRPFQHLERYYFEKGDLGFTPFSTMNTVIGMALCNDRRWPETYRCYGLQKTELLLLGYNTPLQYVPKPEQDHLQSLHHSLSLQAGAYQNGMWVVACAKAGNEDNFGYMLNQSMIVAPTGEIACMSTSMSDEVINYNCNLDLTLDIKDNVFNFDLYREPSEYKIITQAKTKL